jgi:hypothetical protein
MRDRVAMMRKEKERDREQRGSGVGESFVLSGREYVEIERERRNSYFRTRSKDRHSVPRCEQSERLKKSQGTLQDFEVNEVRRTPSPIINGTVASF